MRQVRAAVRVAAATALDGNGLTVGRTQAPLRHRWRWAASCAEGNRLRRCGGGGSMVLESGVCLTQ
jgi:hypothetical protein